jgi:hypothetical protein
MLQASTSLKLGEISLPQAQKSESSTSVLKEISRTAISRLVILRREYVDLISSLASDADRKSVCCAAMVLDYFGHWQRWKIKVQRTHWVYQPLKNIHQDLMGMFSKHVIREALALLMNLGLLERRTTPNNYQDKTYQYNPCFDRVNSLLKRFSPSTPETPSPSPFVHSQLSETSPELSEANVEQHTQLPSIAVLSKNTHESEEQKENVQEVVSYVVIDTTSLESDEALWEEKTLEPIPDESQSSAPRDTKKVKVSQAAIIKELLSCRIFQLWWANRVKQTKFGTEQLILTPEAFVKASIRKHPEQALDMYESFQDEMGKRVENFQIRKAHDCVITSGELEQIQAIAPYAAPTTSAPVLPPTKDPEAPDLENTEAYKLYQPKQVEAAPPPAGILERLKQAAERLSMSKAPKVEVSSELDELNRWIADPLLRPEAVQRVMASDLYTVEYNEEGVAYQVRRV